MKYVQLGRTDLNVSRVCFGCWQLSPRFWGEVDLDDWRSALDRAVEIGVNFIDTADAYGDGYAEDSLGDWFAASGQRDRFILATKFYWNFEQEDRFPDTRYDYIIRECEASLKRLKTDRIDLYQIHAWDPLLHPEMVASAFTKLKEDGKVRWFGVSNWNSDQIRMFSQYYDISCLQPLYNLLDRDAEAREFPVCVENKIGVITYSSLARGLLTGKYAPDEQFTDSRASNPRFAGRAFTRLLQGVEELKPFAEKYGLTTSQLAVSWILTHPAVTSAIVGIKKPEHIESIAPATDVTLENKDWHKIAGIIRTAKEEASS